MAITFESPLRSGLSPLSRLSGLHPLGKVSIYLFVFNSALLDLRRDGDIGHLLSIGAELSGEGPIFREETELGIWPWWVHSCHVPSDLSSSSYIGASTYDTVLTSREAEMLSSMDRGQHLWAISTESKCTKIPFSFLHSFTRTREEERKQIFNAYMYFVIYIIPSIS